MSGYSTFESVSSHTLSLLRLNPPLALRRRILNLVSYRGLQIRVHPRPTMSQDFYLVCLRAVFVCQQW